MANITLEELVKKSDEDLARFGERNDPRSSDGILHEKAWQIRLMEKQHELDIKLIAKQVRWMKFSVIAVIAAAIISSLLTYFLSRTTESHYQEMLRQMSKQTTISAPTTSSPSPNRKYE